MTKMQIYSLAVTNRGCIEKVECFLETENVVAVKIFTTSSYDAKAVCSLGPSVYVGNGKLESIVSVLGMVGEPLVLTDYYGTVVHCAFIKNDLAVTPVFSKRPIPKSLIMDVSKFKPPVVNEQYGLSAEKLYQEALENGYRFGEKTIQEQVIAKDPNFAYLYALDVVKNPFPPGEAAIAKSPGRSFLYAKNILCGPFGAGEAEMRKDRTVWAEYKDEVLSFEKNNLSTSHELLGFAVKYGPFESGGPEEQKIATDSFHSYNYAKDVLNGRFELGEAAIAKNSYYQNLYQSLLKSTTDIPSPRTLYEKALKSGESYNRNSSQEKVIAADPVYAYLYARDVLKGKFELGEKTIDVSDYRDDYYAFLGLVGKKMTLMDLYRYALENNYCFPKGSAEEKVIAESTTFANSYAMNVVKGRFEPGEKVIFGSEYEDGYRKMLADADKKSAKHLYRYARDTLKERYVPNSEEEKIIAQECYYSILYAEDVIGGRFPLAEDLISKDPISSYDYALNVIKGRWEMGEKAISTNAATSLSYAKNVLKGRFRLGEPAISKNTQTRMSYEEFLKLLREEDGKKPGRLMTNNVLALLADARQHGMFNPASLQEKVIAKNAKASLIYAVNVVKGRFELGEAVIATDARCSYSYATEVLNGPFLLAESTINTDAECKEKYDVFLSSLKKKDVIKKTPKELLCLAESCKKRYDENSEEEKIIATSALQSYAYAKNVLLKRFRLGETAISRDAWVSLRYATNVVLGRFEPGEKAISKTASDSLKYARDVIHDRFELGEKAIFKTKRIKKDYQDFLVSLEIQKDVESRYPALGTG